MAINYNTMMTGRELADTLRVSRAIVSKWTKEGLPCSYIGKVREARRGSRPRYDMDEVKAWLRSRSAAVEQKVEAVPDAPPPEKGKPGAGAKVGRVLTPREEQEVKRTMRRIDCTREEAMPYVERMAKQKGGEA